MMKKLRKPANEAGNTIEAYACACKTCSCRCFCTCMAPKTYAEVYTPAGNSQSVVDLNGDMTASNYAK
ncbi:MAG: hypothetical protein HFJ79_00155 [Clostridiales bacterium]|jgi:putative bacteriocin precursor|nr:hypothetical protein [Clostridiales bacterium]